MLTAFTSIFAPARSCPPPLRTRLDAAVADLLELMAQDYTFDDHELDRERVAAVVRFALRLIRLGRVLPSIDTALAPAYPALPLWERLTDAAATIQALLREGPFRDADLDAEGVAALEALAADGWQRLEDHFAAVPTPACEGDAAEGADTVLDGEAELAVA